jgi:P-type Mg2+ transporter
MRFSNRQQQQEASGFDGTPTSLSSATSAGKPSAIFTTADLGCSLDPVSESLLDLFARLRSSEDGLTSEEAGQRLAHYGPNESQKVHHAQPFIEFLRFCTNPLVLILLGAGIVSAFIGEFADGAIITAIVILSIVLNFSQTYRSQRAVNRLRRLVAPTATVRRDGNWRELSRREVVPGDIIRLSAGDLVPADARLIRSVHLHVQQAALTGESMPVDKEADPRPASPTPESPGSVFLGTSVVSGTAAAIVFATGRATAFGDIAVRLTTRPPETEFDRGTRQFGILIMKTVSFLVIFILAVNVSFHRGALESLLFAVALAVGLTPEFLPMITTVTLSTGAMRMAQEKVIVKHLAAIENFGSIDVLCTDKTGTITAGVMTLEQAVDPLGHSSQRVRLLGYLNSRFETGIKSPLDDAILKSPPPADTDGWQKTAEIPFDFERRRLTIAVCRNGKAMLISKGAPESIISISKSFEAHGALQPMDDTTRERCEKVFHDLSTQGFRVLAVAYREVNRADGFEVDDEREMVLAGFLAFVDSPLPTAADTIAAMRRDGVRVKVLTGDNELVTRYICTRVGIGAEQIVLGQDLDRMGDAALSHVVEDSDVFARVSPSQKNRIIRALKARSHVVGFLGDGINDAPSLHAADVGISVAHAVDVAKDAAEIILLESGLQVLHKGIVEGRKAFGNVFKYILMGTSSNFGNVFSMAGAVLFLPFLPMMPTQILLNNFLYDLAQVTIPTDNVDPAYTRKPHHWDIRLIRNFMLLIGPISSVYDFLTFFVMLAVFHASAALFHTGWFVESLATQTLVLFIIRTAGRPWNDRPSLPLAMTTVLVVLLGILLPFSPLAVRLGFVALPIAYFAFLAIATVTYLVLVEVVKRRLFSGLGS